MAIKKIKRLEIWINGKLEHTFERSLGNEITAITLVADDESFRL
jgi:hypothetical protein